MFVTDRYYAEIRSYEQIISNKFVNRIDGLDKQISQCYPLSPLCESIKLQLAKNSFEQKVVLSGISIRFRYQSKTILAGDFAILKTTNEIYWQVQREQ